MRPVLHADCPRAPLRRSLHTRCEVVRARDYAMVGTHVVDLSTKGMLLETDATVMTGEPLLVLFRGPSGDWFDCDATVARVVHGRRRRDTRRAVGIAFEPLDPWREIVLCDSLKDAPVASRHLASHTLRARA
jgi:PilZ domain